MSIQHKDIDDSNIHEVKGASTASSKTVCMSNGDGTTSFNFVDYTNLSSLPVLGGTYILTSVSTATSQLPTALDTPLKVSYTATVTPDVSVSSTGDITFNNPGNYQVSFRFNQIGRASCRERV